MTLPLVEPFKMTWPAVPLFAPVESVLVVVIGPAHANEVALSVQMEPSGGFPAPPHFISVLTVPAAELAHVLAPEK